MSKRTAGVLGISGSPRVEGNTDILLNRALEGAKSAGAKVDKIILNNMKFYACQECEKLRGDGTCRIKDDMRIVYRKMNDADAIILASPVFFGSLSAQMKMMIDRFQCSWRAKYVLNINNKSAKRGAFICAQAAKRQDFFENAKSIVRHLFKAIDVEYKYELFCMGVEGKGDILEHPDYIDKAYELGRDIAGH